MSGMFQGLKNFFRKGDMILLTLCLTISAFSCLIIASTNNYRGFTRYVVVQAAAVVIGIILFIITSSIDADFFSEHRRALVVFNTVLILLLIPFGIDNGTGNRSWLHFPLLPIDIQPAEICKIFFILIMASVMASHQNRLSSIPSVMHMAVHLGLIAVLNFGISSDMGVTLIFGFIFLGMSIAGGIKLIWFAIAGGGLAVIGPTFWNYVMSEEQRNRIAYVFNPQQIDPTGLDEGWHTIQSLKSLTGGGLTGQGLFNGSRTQNGSLNAQHTDFIFSAIGEEMGFIGCLLVMVLLCALVGRCVWVGIHSHDYMRRMICFGAASSLLFQIVCNIGMCLGVMPVIGLTLPLISYGGSSVVTTYAMLGLVSGVHARPSPQSHERYVLPPR